MLLASKENLSSSNLFQSLKILNPQYFSAKIQKKMVAKIFIQLHGDIIENISYFFYRYICQNFSKSQNFARIPRIFGCLTPLKLMHKHSCLQQPVGSHLKQQLVLNNQLLQCKLESSSIS
jgi:hypothetical protein